MARVGNEESDEFPFEDVVGQCCVLVHMLFNLIGEKTTHLVEEIPERRGCVIGGKSVWNLQFADYITVVVT